MTADEWKEEMRVRENLARNEQFASQENLADLVDMGMVLDYFDNDEPTFRCGLDFVAHHYTELRAMVERLCFRYWRLDLADDMFSDAVIDGCDHAFAIFDAARNDDQKGFMFARLHFYCRKWFEKYHKKRAVNVTHGDAYQPVADDAHHLPPDVPPDALFQSFREFASADVSDAATRESVAKYKREISALLATDEAISLLDALPVRDEQVVRMHCMYGFTFGEIADKIGGAESTLRIAYNDAIAALQRLVTRHDDHD